MASTEEYTLVWAGITHDLTGAQELDEIDGGSHPLVKAARKPGLDVFCDTFDVDPVDGEIYKLLIGKQISLLGYKEGVTSLALDTKDLNQWLDIVKQKLALAGIAGEPTVHILLHIQY